MLITRFHEKTIVKNESSINQISMKFKNNWNSGLVFCKSMLVSTSLNLKKKSCHFLLFLAFLVKNSYKSTVAKIDKEFWLEKLFGILMKFFNTYNVSHSTVTYPVKMEYGWNLWLKVSYILCRYATRFFLKITLCVIFITEFILLIKTPSFYEVNLIENGLRMEEFQKHFF